MKTKLIWLLTGLMAVTVAPRVRAEDKPASREELREQWKNLTPEQREAKKKELQEGAHQRREDWQKLSPEEREAKMKEMREKYGEEAKKQAQDLGLNVEELKKLPPEERRAKFREAFQNKLTDLQKKKTAGTITPEEQKQLDRMEENKKRFEEYRQGQGRRAAETKSAPDQGKVDERDARKSPVQVPGEKK